MEKFVFVLGSNWQLSIAELDNVLRNSRFKGSITDYSANVAIVEFEHLHEEKYYINQLEELQFLLGGCQKIAKIYDFIDIRTIFKAFPLKMDSFKRVEKTRKRILIVLNNVIDKIFPNIKNETQFFAV